MALFTHGIASRQDAEINPAADYVSDAVVLKIRFMGKESPEYTDAKIAGFVFCGFVNVGRDLALLVKPSALLNEAWHNKLGGRVTGLEINVSRHSTLARVVARQTETGGIGFTWSYVAGDVQPEEMRDHLVSLLLANSTSEDNIAAVRKHFSV